MNKCGTCKEEKLDTEFYKSSSRKNGLQFDCKACQAKKSLDRYHQKLSLDSGHKKKKATYNKERRKNKGDELRAYDRERAKLPHRRAAHNEDTRKRRAKLKDAIPEDYDREGVLAIYKLAQKLSALTGVEMHVDHVVPLARGGEHNSRNLQILAAPLNLQKGSKSDFKFSWDTPIKGRSYPA